MQLFHATHHALRKYNRMHNVGGSLPRVPALVAYHVVPSENALLRFLDSKQSTMDGNKSCVSTNSNIHKMMHRSQQGHSELKQGRRKQCQAFLANSQNIVPNKCIKLIYSTKKKDKCTLHKTLQFKKKKDRDRK